MSNSKVVMSQAANTLTTPLEVEDVFSTYLYTGDDTNPSAKVNGIDLAGEGGMVWLKSRTGATNHYVADTERPLSSGGGATWLYTNTTDAAIGSVGTGLLGFNSDGFSTFATGTGVNNSSHDYASWTFRKAPKFFDVVTYTGDGTNPRTISHNLGTTVGHITVKPTSDAGSWWNFHRTLGAGKALSLNSTDSVLNSNNFWGGVEPTSTEFTVQFNNNASGVQYVAYLFAHNDGDGEFGPDGDADIIKCGSYTGNGSTNGPEIDLGFEPQWVMIKETSATGNWQLFDSMRGMVAGGVDARIAPNLSSAEDSIQSLTPTATGFQINTTSGNLNTNNSDHIYIAIRRGTKVPESATEVFDVQFNGGNDPSKAPVYQSGFVTDMAIVGYRTGGSVNYPYTGNRLMGIQTLETHNTDAEESGGTSFQWDFMNGFIDAVPSVITDTQIAWMWKRAPGFFDVVAYTGDGASGRTVSHNLGVAPEMMWVKKRSGVDPWCVYHSGLDVDGDGRPETDFIRFSTSAASDSNTLWNDTAPTSTVFTLGTNQDCNHSGETFIAYLFASLPGISKVGSYTGDNTDGRVIDCGFTSGARFILIKKAIGGIGNWYVFDSERGIIAGNDPNLRLDNTGAEQALADIVDPHSSGFILNSAGGLNASGSTYIFYAIA